MMYDIHDWYHLDKYICSTTSLHIGHGGFANECSLTCLSMHVWQKIWLHGCVTARVSFINSSIYSLLIQIGHESPANSLTEVCMRNGSTQVGIPEGIYSCVLFSTNGSMNLFTMRLNICVCIICGFWLTIAFVFGFWLEIKFPNWLGLSLTGGNLPYVWNG